MDRDYEYVIKKSSWKAVNWWEILFIWTIIPIIIIIIRIIVLKNDKTYFCENRIICKYGVLSKHETETAFIGTSAISVDQSLFGRIFKFGEIHIDVIGKWKVTIKGAKRPMEAKEFLCKYIVNKEDVKAVLNE